MFPRRLSLVLLALLPLASLALAPPVSPAQAEERVEPGPTSPLSVVTRTGVYPFEVELADDSRERAQGLMWRRTMPADHGMLFDMGRTGEAAFWMENTYLALDIIFIGENGRVATIAEDAVPLSRALVESDAPVRFVLELNAGTARRIGLAPGDRVRHERIDSVVRP